MFPWNLHRGVSIDDFRHLSAFQQNLASPLGSREHLATSGIIWNGTTSTLDRNIFRLSRITGKISNPKQKMLKKQQSMFAFFPEHCSNVGVLSSSIRNSGMFPSSPIVEGISKPFNKPNLQCNKLADQSFPSRAHSLEGETTDQTNLSSSKENQKHQAFKNSIVCSIS